MLADVFTNLLNLITMQVANVPIDNTLGMVYTVLNLVATVVLTLLGFTGEGGGSILPF